MFSVVLENGEHLGVFIIRQRLEGTTTNNFKHGQGKLSTVPRVWTIGEEIKPS